jgi:hypothetical protein
MESNICKYVECDKTRVNTNFCAYHTHKMFPVYIRYKRLETNEKEDAAEMYGIYSRIVNLREYYLSRLKPEHRDAGHLLAITKRKQLIAYYESKIEKKEVIEKPVIDNSESDFDEELEKLDLESEEEKDCEAVKTKAKKYDQQLVERSACNKKYNQVQEEVLKRHGNFIKNVFLKYKGDQIVNNFIKYTSEKSNCLQMYTVTAIYAFQLCLAAKNTIIVNTNMGVVLAPCCFKTGLQYLVRNKEFVEFVINLTRCGVSYAVHQPIALLGTIKLVCKYTKDAIITEVVAPRINIKASIIMPITQLCNIEHDVMVQTVAKATDCPGCDEELELKLPYKSLKRHYCDGVYNFSQCMWLYP